MEKKNIHQKLQEVRQNVLAMREDAQGYGYSYGATRS